MRSHAEELLGQEIRHTERSADGLLLLTDGPVNTAGLLQVEDTFGPTRAVKAAVFENLLIGLLGARGETLALGILEKVDFSTGRLNIFSPLHEGAAVRSLRLGFLQLARDGTQLASLDPAELG